ncbi:MAG: dihydroorotate dehydrogenase [Magnetococcales bacterium]|nr:dihydroorotate dehydrogenase [Magnetococcales bacterium]
MSLPGPELQVRLAGLELATPLVLLSGCVGFGEELLTLDGFDCAQIGAICLKGTTLEPRRGNPPCRIVETHGGMLNAIGLQNPGVRAVTGVILPRLLERLAQHPHGRQVRLLANVAGATVPEYAEVARLFDDSPVDAIEINISCPNVKEGGVAFGSDPAMAARVVAAVRAVTRKPVITKLSPNVTSIRAVARAVAEAGTDGFAVINTLMGLAVDAATRRPVLGNVTGGLSGPAIKPVALLKVWEVFQEVRDQGLPIIGQGGIATATDAAEFLIAGATAVGLGTVLFQDALRPARINRDLADFMARHGIARVADLTGTLHIG